MSPKPHISARHIRVYGAQHRPYRTLDPHIRASHYARSAEGKMPHQVVEKPKYMWLSGLDLLQVDDSVHLPVDASRFVNVGERCNEKVFAVMMSAPASR